MIVERNEFRLKFGKAKEGIAIWKDIMEVGKSIPEKTLPIRLMSDISGNSYTLIVEMEIKTFNDINPKNYVWVTNPKFQELYQKFIPLCESSKRTYYNIEAEY
jgi:hypothetical protein